MNTIEQPEYTPVRDLLKATWRKASIILVFLLVLLGISVFITNMIAYFSVQINPYVMGMLSASVYSLSMLVPIFILAYVFYVLIKAK